MCVTSIGRNLMPIQNVPSLPDIVWTGGSNYKGIDLVLDYQSLKDQTAGYQIPSSVRCEEVFVPEGAPVMPLYSASQTALAEFGEKNLEPVPNIDVPFSSLEPTALPRERNEYITLDWLIKYGGTPGCGACCLQRPGSMDL